MKTFFKKIKDFIYPKYWNDSVWSKVIATIIFAFITIIWLLLKSLFCKIPFDVLLKQLFDYLLTNTEVNNTILWLSIIILTWVLISFIVKLIKRNKTCDENSERHKIIPTLTIPSDAFFKNRLADAFPGQRGLKWYEPKIAVERLKILLKEPLIFNTNGKNGCPCDPIWWFRGHSALFIENFKVLSKTKILINIEELDINRIAVYIGDIYYKCFIYVETKAEKQTGLYNIKTEEIQRSIENIGYCAEEYGLKGKLKITRNEHDDGGTVVKNKAIDASDAELRVRYLSDYNFIIAAKQSPYNSRRVESDSIDFLNGILKGTKQADALLVYLMCCQQSNDH